MKKAKKFPYGCFLPKEASDSSRFKKKITPKPHQGIRMRQVLPPWLECIFLREENQNRGWILPGELGQFIKLVIIDGKFNENGFITGINRKKRKIKVHRDPLRKHKHGKRPMARVVHAKYMMKLGFFGGFGGVSMREFFGKS